MTDRKRYVRISNRGSTVIMIGSDCSPDIFDQLKDVRRVIQKLGVGLV